MLDITRVGIEKGEDDAGMGHRGNWIFFLVGRSFFFFFPVSEEEGLYLDTLIVDCV